MLEVCTAKLRLHLPIAFLLLSAYNVHVGASAGAAFWGHTFVSVDHDQGGVFIQTFTITRMHTKGKTENQ